MAWRSSASTRSPTCWPTRLPRRLHAAFLDGTAPTDTCDHPRDDHRNILQKIFGLGKPELACGLCSTRRALLRTDPRSCPCERALTLCNGRANQRINFRFAQIARAFEADESVLIAAALQDSLWDQEAWNRSKTPAARRAHRRLTSVMQSDGRSVELYPMHEKIVVVVDELIRCSRFAAPHAVLIALAISGANLSIKAASGFAQPLGS